MARILFDDVLTSGCHLVARYRRLFAQELSPIAGLVIGRATQEQRDKVIGWVEEELEVEERPSKLKL